jgi:hypothetical protein
MFASKHRARRSPRMEKITGHVNLFLFHSRKAVWDKNHWRGQMS